MSKIATGLLFLAAAQPSYRDFWIVTETRDLEKIIFIDKSSIEDRGSGWKSFGYEAVYNGSSNKAYKSERSVGWVKCASRTFMIEMVLAYGRDGRLAAENNKLVPEHPVAAGSVEELLLNFVCGNQTGLTQLPRDGETVATADRLYAQLAAGSQAAANSPRPAATAQPSPPKPSAPVRPAPAVSPKTTSSPIDKAVTAPGLGQAIWKILDADDDFASVFTPATVKRTPGAGHAWITRIYQKPQNFGDVPGVIFSQTLYEADCVHNTMGELQFALYNDDGDLTYSRVISPKEMRPVQPGTRGFGALGIMCGRPVELYYDKPLKMDAHGVRFIAH